MTGSEIFVGLGLLLGLAVGCQIVATTLRVPAIVLLLPVGFVAGALTSTINPNELFGAAFPPMVSLAVAVILFEGGLDLQVKELEGHSQRIVRRLIAVGCAHHVGRGGTAGVAAARAVVVGRSDARGDPHRVWPDGRWAAAGAGPPGPSTDDDPRVGGHDHRPHRRHHRGAGVPGPAAPTPPSGRAASCSSSQPTSDSASSAARWAPLCSGCFSTSSGCAVCSPRKRPSPPSSPSPRRATRCVTTRD